MLLVQLFVAFFDQILIIWVGGGGGGGEDVIAKCTPISVSRILLFWSNTITVHIIGKVEKETIILLLLFWSVCEQRLYVLTLIHCWNTTNLSLKILITKLHQIC